MHDVKDIGRYHDFTDDCRSHHHPLSLPRAPEFVHSQLSRFDLDIREFTLDVWRDVLSGLYKAICVGAFYPGVGVALYLLHIHIVSKKGERTKRKRLISRQCPMILETGVPGLRNGFIASQVSVSSAGPVA